MVLVVVHTTTTTTTTSGSNGTSSVTDTTPTTPPTTNMNTMQIGLEVSFTDLRRLDVSRWVDLHSLETLSPCLQ